MTPSKTPDTRWRSAGNKHQRGQTVLDDRLYVSDGTDVIGYDLGTGRGTKRLTDVGVTTLVGSDTHRLLAGLTSDSVVAIDPRSGVRWRWDDPRSVDFEYRARLAATEDDLYVLFETDPEAEANLGSGQLTLVRFPDFTTETHEQVISRPRDHGDSAPPKIGRLAAHGEWVYVPIRGSDETGVIDRLVGWHTAQDNWAVDLDGWPDVFDVDDRTVYMAPGGRDTQSFVAAYDRKTGARLWNTATPEPTAIASTDGGAVIGGGFGVLALENGSVAWELSEHAVADLAADDGTVFTVGSDGRTGQFAAIDVEGGARIAGTELESPPGFGVSVTALDDAVTVVSDAELVCFERPDRPSGTAGNDGTGTGSDDLCPSCGEPVPPGASFCPTCGTSLDDETCPDCGAELDGSERYCPQCGTDLAG